jgi:hypothetical protein
MYRIFATREKRGERNEEEEEEKQCYKTHPARNLTLSLRLYNIASLSFYIIDL